MGQKPPAPLVCAKKQPSAASEPPTAVAGPPATVVSAGGQAPAAVKPPVDAETSEVEAAGLEQSLELLPAVGEGAVAAQPSAAVVPAGG